MRASTVFLAIYTTYYGAQEAVSFMVPWHHPSPFSSNTASNRCGGRFGTWRGLLFCAQLDRTYFILAGSGRMSRTIVPSHDRWEGSQTLL